MTLPPEFEQQLERRLEHAAAPVRGDAVSLSGVAARHSQRVARRRRRQAVAAGAFAVLLITGGALALHGDEPTRIDAVGGGTTSSTSSTTSTTSSTTTSTSTTSSTTTTTIPAPVWPTTEARGTHGGSTWGVYLAIATEYDAPALLDARASVEALGQGYRADGGELGCDQGAAESLGYESGTGLYTAALYFADGVAAQRFVDLYEPEVVGIAEVQTYCMD